jgi:hypothetical protein
MARIEGCHGVSLSRYSTCDVVIVKIIVLKVHFVEKHAEGFRATLVMRQSRIGSSSLIMLLVHYLSHHTHLA